MTRFRLTIEYDGTPFNGWQSQENGIGVQDRLEKAVLDFSGEAVRITGAGRTDSGVHALAMTAHMDLTRTIRGDKLRQAINAYTRPDPVVVLEAAKANDDFDARFSAKKRHYLYRILNRRAPPALLKNRVWHVPVPLDTDAMTDAAAVLVGHHDFTTFRSIRCQAKSPEKTLEKLDISRTGDEIRIEAAAPSFLHHQVRSMVGCLKLVGEGRWTKADLKAALDARDRTELGLNAPARGLYFVRADY